MTVATITSNRVYEPRGAALALWKSHAPELVIEGSAGTGKSRSILQKVLALADKYQKSRHLFCRQTRVSMTQSVLVTFEEKVVPIGHPMLNGPSRAHRASYTLPNGSEIVIGGLDNPERLFSTEYDTVSVFEATETTENSWESLHRALRNGRMGWHQAIADCNPGPSGHWLNQRANTSKMKRLLSRHEDNPELFDVHTGTWTPHGRQYIERLDALTGVRRLRLRLGKWASAEGMVYEGWDPAVHLIDRFDVPIHWPRIWGIDFGYTLKHPFVWCAWALHPLGRLIRYREIHHTGRIVEDHAKQILEVTGWKLENDGLKQIHRNAEPLPVAVICDHDAEGRATFERHTGLITTPAFKSVLEGIEAVMKRLRVAGDGKPGIMLMRDSLVETDPALLEAKRPTCGEQEFDGYVWDTSMSRRKGEQPVKDMDDFLDQMRYVVAAVDDIANDPSDQETFHEYYDPVYISGI